MTIASEVQRIKTNIASAYTALEEKGATIPETQNSANLVDAIGSVSTGGGDVSTDDMKKVNNIISKYSEYSSNFKVLNSAKNSDLLIGLTFTSEFSILYLRIGGYTNVHSIMLPDGAIIEDIGDTEYKKVTFANNERWAIITQPSNENINIKYFAKPNMETTSYYMANCLVSYANLKYLSSTDLELSFCDTLGDLSSLCSFKCENILFKDTSIKSILGSLDIMPSNILALFLNYAKNIHADDTITSTELGIASWSTNVGMLFTKWQEFPFIIDFSTYTETTTIKSSYGYPMAEGKPISIKIVLPSTVDFSFYLYKLMGSGDYFCLTKESLEFLAENAPTVSGKTLTLGYYNKQNSGGENSEIIQKLTSKGWTVK